MCTRLIVIQKGMFHLQKSSSVVQKCNSFQCNVPIVIKAKNILSSPLLALFHLLPQHQGTGTLHTAQRMDLSVCLNRTFSFFLLYLHFIEMEKRNMKAKSM